MGDALDCSPGLSLDKQIRPENLLVASETSEFHPEMADLLCERDDGELDSVAGRALEGGENGEVACDAEFRGEVLGGRVDLGLERVNLVPESFGTRGVRHGG